MIRLVGDLAGGLRELPDALTGVAGQFHEFGLTAAPSSTQCSDDRGVQFGQPALVDSFGAAACIDGCGDGLHLRIGHKLIMPYVTAMLTGQTRLA